MIRQSISRVAMSIALVAVSIGMASFTPVSAQEATPASASAAPFTPPPSPKPGELVARLGAFDARAQRIVTSEPVSSALVGQGISDDWPALRSALVQAGAKRADLIVADSAVLAVKRQEAAAADPRRAANALTAALAPIYPVTGDRVPPRVHRLDSLQRSIALDVAAADWVRATSDAVSVRSAWRAVRAKAAIVVGATPADRYDRAIGGVDDAIGARNAHRTMLALRNADRDLAAIEHGYDHQEAPWRRFIRSHFGV